jgi:hypothetical protein
VAISANSRIVPIRFTLGPLSVAQRHLDLLIVDRSADGEQAMGKHLVNGQYIEAATWRDAQAEWNRQHPPPPVQAPPLAPQALIFTATVTPVEPFNGRSPTKFGVGEQVDLGFTNNQALSAASFGGLRWHIKSGPAAWVSNVINNNGTARLAMGNTAGTVVVELRVVGSNEVKVARTLWVVEPSSAVMHQEPGTGTFHRNGTASAGFKGEIFLRPTDVSFSRCQFREGASTGVGTGSMAITVGQTAPTSQSTGQRQATQSELATLDSGNVRHPVRSTWAAIGPGHSTHGCKVVGVDTVEALERNPPYAVGTFIWDIPWLFRVIGSTEEKVFHTARHEEAVTAQGHMTITKNGGPPNGFSVPHHAADLDSAY